MATGSKIIDIQGKVKFIHAVNMSKFDKWTITLYPNMKSLEVIRELQAEGLKNVMKKDDDGYYISFHRDPTKMMRGKVVAFAAPRVVDKEGKPIDGSRVGWNSDVTVRLEIYKSGPKSTFKYIGARWDSLRVDELVEFAAERSDWTEEEKENVKSLTESPPQEEEVW